MASSVPKYEPVGRCIYCGATRHSDRREKLGDEHIIPEGLGGTLLLPLASCGKCEGLTTKSETFCQKETLAAFRYQQNLPTKRPKERPTTLPVTVLEDGVEVTKQVPIADYPVRITVPQWPKPEILLRHPVHRTSFYQLHVWPEGSPIDEMSKLFGWGNQQVQTYITSEGVTAPTGKIHFRKFARMLAKIAHSYTVAELGLSGFVPLLHPAINPDFNFPLEHMIGGAGPRHKPGTERHEISLRREHNLCRSFWVVRLRLFSDFGFPAYDCVSGAVLGSRQTMPMKMLAESPKHRATQRFAPNRNPALIGPGPVDHLCAKCEDVVSVGSVIQHEWAIRCAKCHTWNVTYLSCDPWGMPDDIGRDDGRALWKSSNSTKSSTSSR